jgi:hypothetical protein
VEQVFIVRLPGSLARQLSAFLEHGATGYDSLNEFVAGAIANQLNLLAATPGTLTKPEHGATNGATPRHVNMPDVTPVSGLPVPEERSEPLFVLTNRLAPIKVAVRVLANLCRDGKWPPIATFHREAAAAARMVGLSLRAEDEKMGRTGYDRRWIGFPVGEDEVSAEARFITCFTIQTTRSGGAFGPLAILGLANLSGGRVGLTKAGITLAMLPSPLLGEVMCSGALSAQEIEVLRASLQSAPGESAAFDQFLAAVRESRGLQRHIDRMLAKAHPDWSVLRTKSHRAAMIGRLSDLTIIKVLGKGPTSRVQVMDDETLSAKQSGWGEESITR